MEGFTSYDLAVVSEVFGFGGVQEFMGDSYFLKDFQVAFKWQAPSRIQILY